MYSFNTKFTGTNAELISFKEFKLAIYSLKNAGLLSVEEISGYEYPKNYYKAKVKDSSGSFSIYANCYTGEVGFGEITNNSRNFVERAELAQQLGKQYTVLGPDILASPVTECCFSDLDASVKKEVKNWLPETIGGLLFCWYFD
ncbi:hypothetical protein [Vibrio sp. SCSIO 43137]|uniref:hypothetical protein n=1 Tax=Vibrio sp. SCSIO 43137 TaxID=3021011 RepID=UPI0023071E1B|nr:hypothetical protein [Vibrio sp. SCSIO 43137]WCE32159.1 hypothetical protein PK654_16800 [Vibrio sp. SCSIO 43137]